MTLDGHHLDYIKTLTSIKKIEPLVVLDAASSDISAKQIVLSDCVFGSKSLMEHLRWIRKIKKILNVEKPDVVHFVWGDSFYRFLGIGFHSICKRYNTIITFHQVRKSCLHQLSLRIYGKLFDRVVVHTSSLKKYLSSLGISNCVHIEYPNFRTGIPCPRTFAQKKLGFSSESPVLLCLGGTRRDKGLDILLEALQTVSNPFFLLIAGTESSIKRETIEELSKKYVQVTHIILRHLSVEEVNLCLNAADIVVLPYRKTFDGASGPLAEGVGLGKCIVGADHGSLGEIIRDHHLGYIFESENIASLSETLNQALKQKFVYDSVAEKYRNSLTVKSFQNTYTALYYQLNKQDGKL